MPGPKLSPLTHIFAFTLAVLIGAVTFLATSATAATGVTYRAELVAPAPESRFVIRDTVWKCSDTHCIAGQSGSRPAIVCALLVREVGPLTGFSTNGKPLTAAELARCNARD